MGSVLQNFGMTSPVEGRIFLISLVLALFYTFVFSCVRIYFTKDKEMLDKQKRAEFLTTMLILSPTISLIMVLIGQDIASAFALLGIMSIVRFRNPSKGAGDIIYYLVAITLGMTCGEHYFLIGGIFCVFISILLALSRFYGLCFFDSKEEEVSDSEIDDESEKKVFTKEKKEKKKEKKHKKKDKEKQHENTDLIESKNDLDDE